MPPYITSKKIGIWLDHASAHLTEFTSMHYKTQVIESSFTRQVKEDGRDKCETLMHQKEQHLEAEYYDKLGAIIRNHDEVLLFGPTSAKDELFNILRADHLFDKIEIEVQRTDKMTEAQQQAFVKEYFSKKCG